MDDFFAVVQECRPAIHHDGLLRGERLLQGNRLCALRAGTGGKAGFHKGQKKMALI
jgi:hypothetical protein